MKTIAAILCLVASANALERLPYNNPGLAVDLGVGLWAWSSSNFVDFDGDGIPDFLGRAEDGRFYRMKKPRAVKAASGSDSR